MERLLRTGSEYFGLDLKYFAFGGFWTSFGQFVNGLLSFLLAIAFANLLTKETFGSYQYLLSLADFFSIFTLSGMNSAVFQAVASGNEGTLKYAVKYQIKWNTAMTTILLGIAGYYFWQQNYVFTVSLIILGVISPLTSALNTYGAFLGGKKDFKRDNIYSIWSTIIYAAGMLLTLLINKKIAWLILVYSLTTLGANMFFYWRTIRIYNPPETQSPEMIKYGWQLTLINFIYPIVNQIDKIVLNYFWGPVELAVYFLARTIPDKVYSMIKTWISVGMPKLAERSTEDIKAVFLRRVIQGLALGALIAGAYILIIPFIFKYLLPKYLESIRYSQLLAVTFIFAAPQRYLGSIFTIKKIVRPTVIATFINNIIKIVLYIVLGIWSGIMGLVIAELIFQIIGFFVNITTWKLVSFRIPK